MTHSATSLVPDASDRGQCEASRVYNYHNDRPTTDRQCKHSARFVVDGKRLCAKHAGVAALHILLKQTKGPET